MAINVCVLAKAKKLPVSFLRQLGLEDLPREQGVGIAYYDRDGGGIAVKRRTALIAKEGTYWPANTPVTSYGQWKLLEARKNGELVLVEGESDCWTLWYHQIAALGLPGAGTAHTLKRDLFDGVRRLYLHVERDKGGDLFHESVLKRLGEIGFDGEVRVLQMPEGIHDPSELHQADESRFLVRWDVCVKSARPVAPTHLHPQVVGQASNPATARQDRNPVPRLRNAEEEKQPAEAVQVNLANVPIESVEWLWASRIPFGKLTILDGDPGLGKSSILLDIAARLTQGKPMPFAPTQAESDPARVILVTTEDGLGDTIRPRLEAAGAALHNVTALKGVGWESNPNLGPFSLPMHTHHLETVLAESDAKLVVLDPLMAFLDESVVAHNDQSIRRALQPLAQLAERRKVAIVVVRHLNKQAGRNALYRGGGSIGIIGAVRSGLMVCKDPDDPNQRLLGVTKCNLCKPPRTIRFELIGEGNAMHVHWIDEAGGDVEEVLAQQETQDMDASAEAEAFLLARFAVEASVPAVQIMREAADLGIKEKTLKRAKKRLNIDSKFFAAADGNDAQWRWLAPLKQAA